MTETSITLTALACAIVFFTTLDHWLYLERQWLRIQLRRQNQLANARAAISRRPRSQPISTMNNSAPISDPTDVADEQVGETWQDWFSLAERLAQDDAAETLAYSR